MTPYAHIDFQPSRVTGMTVFGAQLYHPCLKMVVPLFKYYAEDETSETAVEGLQHFNELLKRFTNGECGQFDPAGWMSDEAGSLIKAMDTVYGEGIHAKMVVGGTGRSLTDIAKISEAQQMARASDYAKNVTSSSREMCSKAFDVSATHREDKIADDQTGKVSFKSADVIVPTLSKDKAEKRLFKIRDISSKDFKEVRDRAINEIHEYNIAEKVGGKCRTFSVARNNSYDVVLSTAPTCKCLYFVKNKGKKVCKHMVMALLCLGVDEEDALLYQVGYTESEVEQILRATYCTYVKKHIWSFQETSIPKHQLYLTEYLKGSRPGKRFQCTNVNCKKPIADGLVVAMDGKQKYGTHSKDKTFYYCLDDECLTIPPKYSDIRFLPKTILSKFVSSAHREEAIKTIRYSIA